MLIERYPYGPEKVSERFRAKGRMLPQGLIYLDSWLEEGGARCFQLMETPLRPTRLYASF